MPREIDPAALEKTACMLYSKQARPYQPGWAIAAWEQLDPKTRGKFRALARQTITTYLQHEDPRAAGSAPPGAAATFEVLDRHRQYGHTCACGWNTNWKNPQMPTVQWQHHVAALIEKGNTA